MWTLYGHIPGEGWQAVGDFGTRERAEEVFRRITGLPFAEPRAVAARVRVMHAGPKLLEAVKLCHALIRRAGVRPDIVQGIALHERAARAAASLAEATGGTAGRGTL